MSKKSKGRKNGSKKSSGRNSSNRKTSDSFVRITGGEFKGIKIRTPGGDTHPMGERERIALFNMISDRIQDAWVLDLFSGGGTLGLEAMSRGAASVMMVENNYNAVTVAADNMVDLGLSVLESKVAYTDAREVMRVGEGDEYGDIPTYYSLVFADPPYDEYSEKLIEGIGDTVTKGGTLVLSHPGEAPKIDGLELEKTHQYANAHISIYKKPGKLTNNEKRAARLAKIIPFPFPDPFPSPFPF